MRDHTVSVHAICAILLHRSRGRAALAVALFAWLALAGGCKPDVEAGRENRIRAAWKRRFVGDIVAVGLNAAGTLAVVATMADMKDRGDDLIIALDERGTEIWERPLDRRVVDLAVAANGTLVVASLADGTLHAWGPGGDALWESPCGGNVDLSASGDLIACHGGGDDSSPGEALQALDGKGRSRWTFDDPAGIWDLAVSDAGDGVVGLTQAGKLVALDARGRVLWTRELGPVLGTVTFSPGDGGVVIVGTGIEGEKLLAFDRAGKPLWSAVAPGGGESIAVSRGGAFVVVANNTTLGQRVSVFDGHGRLFWQSNLDRPAQEAVKVGISESGERVFAAIERDGRPEIAVWDNHGEVLGASRYGSQIRDFRISRDGRHFIAAVRGGRFFYYNLRQGAVDGQQSSRR